MPKDVLRDGSIVFPISIEGEFPLHGAGSGGPEAALQSLQCALTRARVREVTRAGDSVTFKVGIARLATNWNVLSPVESGVVSVVPGHPSIVRYRFACVHLLVVVTVAVFGLAIGPALAGDSRFALEMLIGGWLWLFGLNYLIASLRLPSFIRQAVGQ